VWGEVPGDPLVQPRIERGPAGWVLVNLASRPGDVLVVGAGRRGRLARLAFSRVSRYCLAHARCPVIAIPPPALARELGHGRLAWVFWHRPLTPEQILRDQGKPAACGHSGHHGRTDIRQGICERRRSADGRLPGSRWSELTALRET